MLGLWWVLPDHIKDIAALQKGFRRGREQDVRTLQGIDPITSPVA